MEMLTLSLLEFQDVSFSNDGQAILNHISMKIESGDFISVVGPSGSGKSTLLKLCSHLISPTEGKIIYKNKSVMEYNPTELRKSITYCFQTPYLFGKTVRENIIYPYTIRNVKPDQNRIQDLFSMIQMPVDYLNKDVRNLSGGEKQRIALIRSLIYKPEILLLDEITSALDVDNTQIVENVISKMNEQGTTILWITHNPQQSKKYANKLLTIEAGKLEALEVIA
jgi:putative ABC transport system ATP-binding protein